MASTYENYFNIDPKYYAAVTADLIRQGKVSWKKFYPHETFVKLLETTYRVLSGKANRSIWVEGAYGTGKSHAALTVKSLLEASDEDVREYFDDFGLSPDLREKYISLKHSGKILTVHRIGSSDIHNDQDLVIKVQESILEALKKQGIYNHGEGSMKDAFLDWVQDEGNRDYFQTRLKNPKYLLDFSGMNVADVVHKLETGTPDDVEHLMKNVVKVLKDSGFNGLLRDTNQMAPWIDSIIKENGLSSILFVWDEFSEFFMNNPNGLTDFQNLLQISGAYPFYFLIVAHQSSGLFQNAKQATKILDRFETPVKIELPENMAFKLMAQAMKVTNDPAFRTEWASDKSELNNALVEARQYIIKRTAAQNHLGKKTHLSDEELQAIVPLHPYAALLLKHIATVFNSNQRSMFDFIISNDMTDAKGFKWFIHNYGALSDINLLTIDLLWDFFCGKQKMGLNDDVRGVLDSYGSLQLDKLSEDEKRVVKTLLLFQAISLRINNDLLRPDKENLDMAFSGTDWNKGKAINIASALVSKGFLFKKPAPGGEEEYCVAVAGSGEDMKPYMEKADKQTITQNLIVTGALQEAITVPASVHMRYMLDLNSATSTASFRSIAAKLNMKIGVNRFKILVTFAMDDREQASLDEQIRELTSRMDDNWVVIQTLVPLGMDLKKQYRDNLGFSFYHERKDRMQASHYAKQAVAVLNDWKNKISAGAFMVYTAAKPNGERMANMDDLKRFLMDWDREIYFYGVEQYELNDTMYGGYSLGVGALCGIQEKLTGAYNNKNKSRSFEHALVGVWQVPEYWKKPELQSLPVVHIKKKVEELIAKGFQGQAGRISMHEIWKALSEAPYGFMPISVCALILGFVLKEYANPKYFWTNGSVTKPMSPETMKDMISDTMTSAAGVKKGSKEQYIVTMTPEVRCFLEKTAKIFHIPLEQCASVESARNQLRIQMKRFTFPLWTVKSILTKESLQCPTDVVSQLIDEYTGIANDANYGGETPSTLAEKIGRQLLKTPALVEDMNALCQSQKTEQGMAVYLGTFRDGLLVNLAKEIQDGGRYIDRVKAGFDADEANWVWNVDTANRVISDVILEYQIVKESAKCVGLYSSYDAVLEAWWKKADCIKIPCEILKHQVGALGNFLQQLLLLDRAHTIQSKDKEVFYSLLCQQGDAFNQFYANQIMYFKKVIVPFCNGLREEQIEDLYYKCLGSQFARTADKFNQDIQARIAQLHQNEVREKLQRLWQEKTGTEDAREWSRIHRTPILCLFEGIELEAAKRFLPLIGQKYSDEKSVKEAISYLEQATFYDELQDASYIDQCFMNRVVGDSRILLKNIEEIRSQLYDIDSDVYHWQNSETVRNQLKKMRDQVYRVKGKAMAEKVLLQMSSDQLLMYLKDKLQDPNFGIQILKGQK